MSKELVKTGQRMYELAAKLEAEQQTERAPDMRRPSPAASFVQRPAPPPVDRKYYKPKFK